MLACLIFNLIPIKSDAHLKNNLLHLFRRYICYFFIGIELVTTTTTTATTTTNNNNYNIIYHENNHFIYNNEKSFSIQFNLIQLKINK